MPDVTAKVAKRSCASNACDNEALLATRCIMYISVGALYGIIPQHNLQFNFKIIDHKQTNMQLSSCQHIRSQWLCETFGCFSSIIHNLMIQSTMYSSQNVQKFEKRKQAYL